MKKRLRKKLSRSPLSSITKTLFSTYNSALWKRWERQQNAFYEEMERLAWSKLFWK
jgi:hypothetical protein